MLMCVTVEALTSIRCERWRFDLLPGHEYCVSTIDVIVTPLKRRSAGWRMVDGGAVGVTGRAATIFVPGSHRR